MEMLHTNFIRPTDWPLDGDIDLSIHDLPHQSSTTEWWYINAHIKGENGRDYAVFASFFRKLLAVDEKTLEPDYAHSITWAIIDVKKEKYYHNSLVDKRTPAIGLQKLKKGEILKDERLRKAAIEMLEKGAVPYPDRLFNKGATTNAKKLLLQYDDNIFTKLDNGNYLLHLKDVEHDVSVKMEFKPKKPAIRHGENGVVFGVTAEDMFYYFIPRNEATGYLKLNNKKIRFENASAWYDHEFGRHREKPKDYTDTSANKDVAWNWISSQLSNGYEFTAYDLIDLKTKEQLGSYLILIDDKGNKTQVNNFKLYHKDTYWTSTRTFNDYPTDWILEAPEIDLFVEAKCAFPNQEFATAISKPAFWEGRVEVKGTLGKTKIAGPGFVERSGFINAETMEDFFKVVSRETLKSVQYILPKNPNNEKLAELVSTKKQVDFIKGIDRVEFSKALVEPIRSIIDRGGKSWRSYAALACCDLVGGNSQYAIDWLALPELMHVGSLIVDDVEDKSDIRRGGPSCHLLYNEAVAINAGNACYFIGQIIVYRTKKISDKKRVKIYNLYFEALRSAHAGQSLDIHGLDYMMNETVESGNGKLLEKRLVAIHKLKSAAPASYLAQIGAILGGGTKEQIQVLGKYYEALGIAFQIVDDVLNLSGFENKLKTKAEDITAGKITFPVAKAMNYLEKADRQRLWEIVQMKTQNENLLEEALVLINKVKANEKSKKQAERLINKAWKKLDPKIKDSMVKLNLRAFSWYILDRHY